MFQPERAFLTGATPDANGEVNVPEAPGLGITMSMAGMRRYLVDAEITVNGQVLYRSPKI